MDTNGRYVSWVTPTDTRAEDFEGYALILLPPPPVVEEEEEEVLTPEEIQEGLTKGSEEEQVPAERSLFPGMYAGAGDEGPHPAEKLFEVPESFEDFAKMREFVVRSDLPPKAIKVTMRSLAMAEIFGSKIVPRIIGWYLTGRIAKDREARREYARAIMNYGTDFDEDEES